MRRAVLALLIVVIVVLAGCSGGRGATRRRTAPASSTSASAPSTTSTSEPMSPSTSAPPPATPTTTPATVTTSTASGPTVRIVTFDGPGAPVECNAFTMVELRWRTRGAAGTDIGIDGGGVFTRYPDGDTPHTELLPLPCDGRPHRYRLTAHGPDGTTASRELVVATVTR